MPLACRHCGAASEQPFCCHGCATAFALLASCGLDEHARLRQLAVESGAAARPVPAVPGEWDGWNDPAFLAELALPLRDGSVAVTWSVDGMHCPACVWVLERLPFLDPAVRSASIDLGRGMLRTVLAPEQADLQRLARTAAALGYRLRPWNAAVDNGRRAQSRALLVRAAVAFACAIGSMQLAMNLAAGELTGDLDAGSRWFFGLGSLLLALPAGTWAIASWWRALIAAVRHGRWSLDASAALVVAVGLGASAVNLARGSQAIYADAVAMFIALLLAGRVVLQRVQDHLAAQGTRLVGLLPPHPPAPGSELVLAAGARLPADGTLLAADGAALDVSVLTGEARAVLVAAGTAVFAGCLLVAGTVTLRVERSGAQTRLAGLLATAEAEADRRRPVSESRWERWYGIVLLAVAAVAGWWGIDRAVAVVMAACPCAIGLALPLARAHTLVAARGRGLLIRSADVLLRLRGIRRVVLDKTGTLTTGHPQVVSWTWLIPEAQRAHVAGAIVAAESQARHPVALAICRFLEGAPQVQVEAVNELPGRGLTAQVDGITLSIGPDATGGIRVEWDGAVVARVQVVDGQRPDALTFVTACRQRGWPVGIASGDAAQPVSELAAALGITEARSGQLPEDKAAWVDDTTLMIGDGVNDGLALARAGVGVAVRGGLAAGLACAEVVVIAEAAPLAAVGDLLHASERLRRREALLLTLTVGYNLIAVTCAVLGVWGPFICAVGMPLSSVLAIAIATGWRPFSASHGPQV
jgi:Cu2+-exporting ATPase